MHAFGDTGIALSYAVIALLIVKFVRRRRDLKLHDHPFFYVYAAFIALCGITHGMSVFTRYVSPMYELEGYFTISTMLVSVMAAAITPWSLRHFSQQIHEARNDKQGLEFELDKLRRDHAEASKIASDERQEILLDLHKLITTNAETAARLDEASLAAKELALTAEQLLKSKL